MPEQLLHLSAVCLGHIVQIVCIYGPADASAISGKHCLLFVALAGCYNVLLLTAVLMCCI